MDSTHRTATRRNFIKTTTSSALAFTFIPGAIRGVTAPSNRLNIAAIGVGGRGRRNLSGLETETIVALCDVDMERAQESISRFPAAKEFRDFRILFDEMAEDIDAVVVSTPDHTHYPVVMAAIERGKHVYCEKPLAHSVMEVRNITRAARDAGVSTQMGNQGHSADDIRKCCEWVWGGAIGEVREVHAWSDRPSGGFAFPVNMPRPSDTPPVPETLEWDLWLGPASWRPYHPTYVPAMWRGWLDFGTGALGDMGCHILDPVFWALKLGSPISVEANTTHYREEIASETFPTASIIRYEFPEREGLPPLNLTWFDGGMLPPRPEALSKDEAIGSNGAFFLGSEGTIAHGSHGASSCRILESATRSYPEPPQSIKRIPDHHQDWVDACRGGQPASASFAYGGPLTEMVLLGVIAMRFKNQKLIWDATRLRFTNSEEATKLVTPGFREPWKL